MDIEKEIQNLQERNQRVELEKAWETSWTRRICVAVTTYVVIAGAMFALDMPAPGINAIIPTCGFILSTLGLSFIKNLWIKTGGKKQFKEKP